MAEPATIEAPAVTAPGAPAPSAAPPAPSTPAPSAPAEPSGRAPAAGQVETEAEAPTPEAPKPSPRRDYQEQYRSDPEFKRWVDGTTGSRLDRERRQWEAQQAQQASQRTQQSLQRQYQDELSLRNREEAQTRYLQDTGDPYDLKAHLDAVKQRRDAWDADWEQTRRAHQSAQDVETRIQQARYEGDTERAARGKARADAAFMQLPPAQQRKFAGQNFEDPQDAEAAFLAAYYADRDEKRESEWSTRLEAEKKKWLAEMNRNSEGLDLHGGNGATGTTYQYAEDWEADLVSGKITKDQALRLQARNLPRRRR